jgi:hypothetical protein
MTPPDAADKILFSSKDRLSRRARLVEGAGGRRSEDSSGLIHDDRPRAAAVRRRHGGGRGEGVVGLRDDRGGGAGALRPLLDRAPRFADQISRIVTPGKRGPKPRGKAKHGGNKKIKTGVPP